MWLSPSQEPMHIYHHFRKGLTISYVASFRGGHISFEVSLSHPLYDTIKSKCLKQDLIKITQQDWGYTVFYLQSTIKHLEQSASH